MINVKDSPYLAVGNGITDDYCAIQNAINTASTNEEIYVPAGIYLVSHPIIISANKIRGEHFWRTFLAYN